MLTDAPNGSKTPIYTIAKCLNELIINSNLNDALEKIIEWLPQSLDVDRAYIFQNHPDEQSGNILSSIIHWWEKGIATKEGKSLDYLKNVNTELFPEITESLISRKAFQVSVYDNLSPYLSQMLAATELKTLLLTPIFSGGELWGFIGFGDQYNLRKWKNDEVEMLQSLSAAIGFDVESRTLRTQLYQRNEVSETILSTLNELIWEIDLRKKTVKVMGSPNTINGLSAGEYTLSSVDWMQANVHPKTGNVLYKGSKIF
jgi:GAF domain-containing protein